MNYYIHKYETLFGPIEAIIAICEDGKTLGIPDDPDNTDYQAYLEWVAEGNIAEEWKTE